MDNPFSRTLRESGPQTAAALATRLPFPVQVIQDALDHLTIQGVLEREQFENEPPRYRYVAPERYAQIHLDVVRDPGKTFGKNPRDGSG